MKRWMTGIALAAAAMMLLRHTDLAKQAVEQGLQLCGGSILPTLFPFFAVTELMVRLGYTDALGRIAAPWMERVFHLPGNAAGVFVAGLLGGYPVGAKTAASMYEAGLLNRESAERCLLFCCNGGPAFIIGVVGAGLLGSAETGAFLYGIHAASAVLTGLLLRPGNTAHSTGSIEQQHTEGFSSAFSNAVSKAGSTALQVCAFVLFFRIPVLWLQSILPHGVPSTVLLGSLELTGGMELIENLQLPLFWKTALASGLTAFGGLCVYGQTAAVCAQTGLNIRYYLPGKLLQALISVALTLLLSLPEQMLSMVVLGSICLVLPVLVQITYGNLRRHRL